MRDKIGNKLQKGDLVMMCSKDLQFQVEAVIEPTIKTKEPQRLSHLVLSFRLNITTDSNDEREIGLGDFVKLCNPQSENIIEQLTKNVSSTLRPELVGKKS